MAATYRFFLVAAGTFAAGYLPGRARISLDLPDEVQETFDRAISRRHRLALIGFFLLNGGVLAGIAVLGSLSAQAGIS